MERILLPSLAVNAVENSSCWNWGYCGIAAAETFNFSAEGQRHGACSGQFLTAPPARLQRIPSPLLAEHQAVAGGKWLSLESRCARHHQAPGATGTRHG